MDRGKGGDNKGSALFYGWIMVDHGTIQGESDFNGHHTYIGESLLGWCPTRRVWYRFYGIYSDGDLC